VALSPEDRELIDGCIAGDKPSREDFVRRFSRLVYAAIVRTLKSKGAQIVEQECDDLHNSVFLSFFTNRCAKLRLFEGRNGCSLASWVRMITVRTVLDELRRGSDMLSRRENRANLDLDRMAPEAQASPWACMVGKEQRLLMQKGLQRLCPRDQLVIRLHCLEERPLSQVAEIMEVSQSNIHSVKHRALRRLKDTVAEML
jgi:RNA polymerase sigma factor (sigma-70 family)